jgi:hypothetical protein
VSPTRHGKKLGTRSLSIWRCFIIDSGCIPRWAMSVLSCMSNKSREFPHSPAPQKRVKIFFFFLPSALAASISHPSVSCVNFRGMSLLGSLHRLLWLSLVYTSEQTKSYPFAQIQLLLAPVTRENARSELDIKSALNL